MKLLIGIILSLAVVQTLALPAFENPEAPEHAPVKPHSEIVDAFRVDLDREFTRFQQLYDRSNVAMRRYRLDHVALVTSIYNRVMTTFGDDLDAIFELVDDIYAHIEDRTTAIGSVNACLERVTAETVALEGSIGSTVNECALVANGTFATMLRTIFYPTFAAIQTELSTIPLAAIDALSRGNVLVDEQEIILYLRSQYQVYELQWLERVSRLLRWDISRFEAEGSFLVDNNTLCLADAVIELIFNYSRLLNEIRDC